VRFRAYLDHPEDGPILSFYTTANRKVARHTLSASGPGWAEWDVSLDDFKSAPLANGLYAAVFEAEGKRQILKLLLVR
jgi:hypothetical protein